MMIGKLVIPLRIGLGYGILSFSPSFLLLSSLLSLLAAITEYR
jgi:hypothetical protein